MGITRTCLANDISARPHEILNLKIKDIVFKVTDEGTQYAEVVIKGGKTRPRTIPLIDSIPYVKDNLLGISITNKSNLLNEFKKESLRW
jgi:integrase